ncbi:MAG: phage tail repeat domain-containing protein [Bacteroidetes bacterium]|nr:phage tail repeat domain-containing protein [Bacteroidota bacterium]
MAVLTREQLEGKIDAVITANNNGEITGGVLNDLLQDFKDSFAFLSEFAAALAAKANVEHIHGMGDIIGLGTAITGKADAEHTHAMSDVEGLGAALEGKASTDVATTEYNGLLSNSDKSKIDGIAAGATANDSDANLKNRANHTGEQAINTVTGLQTALDGKANTGHTHTISDVAGLQDELNGKQPMLVQDAGWEAPVGLSNKTSFNVDGVTTSQLAARVKAMYEALNAAGILLETTIPE